MKTGEYFSLFNKKWKPNSNKMTLIVSLDIQKLQINEVDRWVNSTRHIRLPLSHSMNQSSDKLILNTRKTGINLV